jgi:hypothetical protein
MIRTSSRTIGSIVTVLALCIASGFIHADPPPATMVLSLPDGVTGTPGQIIQVPITASPADGVFGIDMTVTYNPAVLTAQDVTVAGIAASAGFVVIKNLNTPGQIVISMFGPQDPLAGSGEIVHVQFQVAGSIGSSTPLTFTFRQQPMTGRSPPFRSEQFSACPIRPRAAPHPSSRSRSP